MTLPTTDRSEWPNQQQKPVTINLSIAMKTWSPWWKYSGEIANKRRNDSKSNDAVAAAEKRLVEAAQEWHRAMQVLYPPDTADTQIELRIKL